MSRRASARTFQLCEKRQWFKSKVGLDLNIRFHAGATRSARCAWSIRA
jgi:hypothetical protein